jgi:hypothetical protein
LDSMQDQMMRQAVGYGDENLAAFTFVWAAYMTVFQATLRSLELIAFGTLPNGIKTEMRSLGYSPVSESSGFSGASQQVSCMRGYWLSVHPETLPITSLTFESTSVDETEVFIEIVSAPACAAGDAGCYTVQNSDLRVNYVFQESNAVNVPPALAVVGDVTSPLFSGLYDVPVSLIETTNNPLVRSNLLTYLLMPADMMQTASFDYFFTMTKGLFDAYAGSASADNYKFPVVLDNDRYPVCNVAEGLPVAATYTPPVDNCVPPFLWSGSAFIPPDNAMWTLAPPMQESAVCSQPTAERLPGIIDGTGPVLRQQDFALALSHT